MHDIMEAKLTHEKHAVELEIPLHQCKLTIVEVHRMEERKQKSFTTLKLSQPKRLSEEGINNNLTSSGYDCNDVGYPGFQASIHTPQDNSILL